MMANMISNSLVTVYQMNVISLPSELNKDSINPSTTRF